MVAGPEGLVVPCSNRKLDQKWSRWDLNWQVVTYTTAPWCGLREWILKSEQCSQLHASYPRQGGGWGQEVSKGDGTILEASTCPLGRSRALSRRRMTLTTSATRSWTRSTRSSWRRSGCCRTSVSRAAAASGSWACAASSSAGCGMPWQVNLLCPRGLELFLAHHVVPSL